MNIRLLTASAMSLTLLAAALPSAALAKDAAVTDSDAMYPDGGNVVVAQDSGKGPKIEGWQTGAGDMSDEDCQGIADQIETAINDAIDNVESNDIDGALANLEVADGMEDLGNTMGCAINYAARYAGDKGSADATPGVVVIAQDGGGDTGGDKDTSCAQANNTANEILDIAGDAFAANDMETGFAMLDLVDAVEADAAAEGCTIKYT